MKSYKTNSISEKIQNEAVHWHVILNGDMASEADWLAFTDWLEADEEHRRACDAIDEILIGIDESNQNITEVSPVLAANKVIDARHRWPGIQKWVAAAAALAAILVIAFGIRSFRTADYEVETFATAIGEQRLITLSDGSTVFLNTNSKIKVMFEDKVRRTELAYGQGLFTVTKDAERPFLVGLGDSHVNVVGTIFDILRHNKEVKITVARGVVEVAPIKVKSSQEIVRLLPGSQLVHQEGKADFNVIKVDPKLVTTWTNGYLEYDDVRLAEVINELNRYFPTPVRVIGKARDLRFSGVIRISDEKGTLLILSEGLPVHIENKHGEMLVLPNAN